MPKHVLIVEDSRTQALRIQLELQRHGLEIQIAETGTAGLKSALQRPPDAIVLDIELPGMNGYTLCRMLKADPRTARIPIIMLTRHDQADETLKGLQVGADDYIPKDTFAEQNLVESLRHLAIV
jgi:DNA-binding response OmpR family regulator